MMKTYRNFEWLNRNFEWLKGNSFKDARNLVLYVCSIWNMKNKYAR